MARDLFEDAGIAPPQQPSSRAPRDLFAEAGIGVDGQFNPAATVAKIRALPISQQQKAFGAAMRPLDEDSRAAVVELMMQTQPGDGQAATTRPAAPQPTGSQQPQPGSKMRETPVYVDPTAGMTNTQKFLAGTGKAFYDIGVGVGQIGRKVLPEAWSNTMGLPTQAEIDEGKRIDAPLMKTKAGIAGNILGNAAMIIPTSGIPGANTYAGAAATGGLLSALQPMATGENRAEEAAKGAAFGAAAQFGGGLLGRALKPIQAKMEPAAAALVQRARDMGIPLNAAQVTGSKPLRWVDSALDNLPFTAGKQAEMKGAQRDVWQNAVLKQAGIDANTASPDVMGAAYSRLGKQFEDLSARNTVQFGNDFIDEVAKIDAARTPFSRGIDSVVNKAIDLASKGQITGREYQSVRSSLTKASKGAWQNNPELGQALKSLRGALDDAAGASMSAEDKSAWDLVRAQYRDLKTIEKAVDPVTGSISPKKFVNEVQRSNPQGMLYGRGDQEIPDLARVGKQFIADTLPDSGTAQRSWYMNMLQNPTAGIGGLLGYSLGGGPLAVAGAVAGSGAPLAAQRALWGNGRYLTKGLLDPVNTKALTRSFGIPTMMQVPTLLE